MLRLPAAQTLMAVNDRLPLQPTTAPDPLLPVMLLKNGHSNVEGELPLDRRVRVWAMRTTQAASSLHREMRESVSPMTSRAIAVS